MEIGERVEVHTRFNDSWSPGFEIAEVAERGYRVRRICDATLLPNVTSESDLRPAPPAPIWNPESHRPSRSDLNPGRRAPR